MSEGTKIDPFKVIGPPSSWGTFGQGEHDADCDAERRALCDYFIRRLNKAAKRGHADGAADLLSGGSVAMAGLFISQAGGVEALDDTSFDNWIAIMTFAWYQAVNVGAAQA